MNKDTRKLAAIMFTDIVGYSRIMSIDETHGMNLLDTHDAILTPIVEEKNGKVLKKIGDAIFAEFKSAVEAVECAIQIQSTLKEYNKERKIDDKIIIRIGIHLGDVVVHGDDLRGEGINIAARLEPLAEPGGICLSQSVYQAVRAQVAMNALRVGEIELKNILEKHVIYKIPAFYAEDIMLDEKGVAEEAEKRPAALKISSIEDIPSSSRSTWGTALSTFLLLLVFLTTVITLGIVAGYSNVKYLIWTSDVLDQANMVERLKAVDDIHIAAIRNQIRRKTLMLVDNYDSAAQQEDKGEELVALIKRVVNDMNREIKKEKLILDEETLGSLNLHDEVKALIQGESSKRDFRLINRRILEAVFPAELETVDEVLTKWELFPRAFSWLWIDSRALFYSFSGFIILYICIFSFLATYIFSLKAIKISFLDIREVDRTISYFVEKLGFKSPIKEGKELVFKAKPLTIIIWNVVTIRARVDGNIILLSGPLIMMNKLHRQIETYSS